MRYRDLQAEYYFISTDTACEGVVEGNKNETALSAPAVEAHLERHRPSDCCPRDQSLLLHERPTGARVYCYKVSSIDSVDRNHSGWLRVLAELDPSQEGVIAHYAGLFWKGLDCKEHLGEGWETRTSSVQIIKRVGGSARDMLIKPTGST